VVTVIGRRRDPTNRTIMSTTTTNIGEDFKSVMKLRQYDCSNKNHKLSDLLNSCETTLMLLGMDELLGDTVMRNFPNESEYEALWAGTARTAEQERLKKLYEKKQSRSIGFGFTAGENSKQTNVYENPGA